MNIADILACTNIYIHNLVHSLLLTYSPSLLYLCARHPVSAVRPRPALRPHDDFDFPIWHALERNVLKGAVSPPILFSHRYARI